MQYAYYEGYIVLNYAEMCPSYGAKCKLSLGPEFLKYFFEDAGLSRKEGKRS